MGFRPIGEVTVESAESSATVYESSTATGSAFGTTLIVTVAKLESACPSLAL
jgi:hypothetical protein